MRGSFLKYYRNHLFINYVKWIFRFKIIIGVSENEQMIRPSFKRKPKKKIIIELMDLNPQKQVKQYEKRLERIKILMNL